MGRDFIQELATTGIGNTIYVEKICKTIMDSTKTGLCGNIYDFAIDYVGINNEKTIYGIHRYLMKKHNI